LRTREGKGRPRRGGGGRLRPAERPVSDRGAPGIPIPSFYPRSHGAVPPKGNGRESGMDISALAMEGASVLVQAMASDLWQGVRPRFAALFGKRGDDVAEGLEQVNAEIEDGEATREDIEQEWAARLRRGLKADPEAPRVPQASIAGAAAPRAAGPLGAAPWGAAGPCRPGGAPGGCGGAPAAPGWAGRGGPTSSGGWAGGTPGARTAWPGAVTAGRRGRRGLRVGLED